MKSIALATIAVAALALSACSTSQNVLLAKQAPPPITTIAQVPDAGNSPEMDSFLQNALVKQGYSVRAPLPAGTRKSDEVDAIVSYIDVWRWDIVMYLQSIAIKMFDARTGDLLATGEWRNSAMHGYHGDEQVVEQLIGEMTSKLRSATTAGAESGGTASRADALTAVPTPE